MTRAPSLRGASLVEVLVCMGFVCSAALTSTALQLGTRRSNLEATLRSRAAHLAGDLAQRMRANSGALPAYLAGGGHLGQGRLGSVAPAPACTNAAPCTPEQLAAHDLWAWERALDSGLPHPGASVLREAHGYRLILSWRGASALPRRDGGGEASFRHSLSLALDIAGPAP